MSNFNDYNNYARDNVVYGTNELTLQDYMVKVFTKMGIGMAITAAVAWLMSLGAYQSFMVATNGYGALLLCAVQLILCIVLSARITTLSSGAASALYYGYAALTGVTFSVLFLAYDLGTVFGAFAFASVLFFSCAVIGHFTKTDMTRFSGLFMGGLIALLAATVISLFVPVLANSLAITYIGLILFLGLTAYDTQKIKQLYYMTNSGSGTLGENLAVYGAFELYLDFINIFLYVLRILGSRSNRRN